MAHSAHRIVHMIRKINVFCFDFICMPFNLMEIFMVSIKFCYNCMGWLWWLMVEANIVTPFLILMTFMFTLPLASSFVFIRFSISCLHSIWILSSVYECVERCALRIEHQALSMKTVTFQSDYKWLWLNAYPIYII